MPVSLSADEPISTVPMRWLCGSLQGGVGGERTLRDLLDVKEVRSGGGN